MKPFSCDVRTFDETVKTMRAGNDYSLIVVEPDALPADRLIVAPETAEQDSLLEGHVIDAFSLPRSVGRVAIFRRNGSTLLGKCDDKRELYVVSISAMLAWS